MIRLARRYAPQLATLALVLFLDWLAFPSFFRLQLIDGRLTGSLVDVLLRGAPTALLALGMAGVIAVRGIDLSVGAVMAIAGAVAANRVAGGSPWWLATIYAVTAGLACGLWNGLLVAYLRLQPIVATLVLMVAGRGVAQLITSGQITTFNDQAFARIASGSLIGLSIPVLIVGAAAATLAILMRSTALGLFVRAIGTNPRAAELAGINTRSIIMTVYALSGFAAALAGIIATADIRGADANNTGLWLELDAILVVILGGGSLLGGRLSYGLTLIGALILQGLKTGMLLSGLPPQMTLIVMAVLICVLLVLQSPVLRARIEASKMRRSPA